MQMVIGDPVKGSLDPQVGHNQQVENHWLRKPELLSGAKILSLVCVFHLDVNV